MYPELSADGTRAPRRESFVLAVTHHRALLPSSWWRENSSPVPDLSSLKLCANRITFNICLKADQHSLRTDYDRILGRDH